MAYKDETYYEEKADYDECVWNADRCLELEEIECKDCEITFSADEQAQMFGGE